MSSLDTYIDAYVTQLTGVRGLSENTQKGYACDLADYARWCERRGVDALNVTHKELRSYLADLSRARYATTTINRRLSAIRGLYNWMSHHGGVSSDAASSVASPKVARVLPKTMTDVEASRLLGDCDASCPAGLRDRAFLELLYASGARISEVSRLDVGSIDFVGGTVKLFGKGAKERVVPLYDLALDWVERYVREARPALLARAKSSRKTDDLALFVSTRGGRMSAGEIAGHFDMTGATISYHLSILKKADLIFETREKNFIYYELNTSVVEEVMLWLSQLKGDNHESNRNRRRLSRL